MPDHRSRGSSPARRLSAVPSPAHEEGGAHWHLSRTHSGKSSKGKAHGNASPMPAGSSKKHSSPHLMGDLSPFTPAHPSHRRPRPHSRHHHKPLDHELPPAETPPRHMRAAADKVRQAIGVVNASKAAVRAPYLEHKTPEQLALARVPGFNELVAQFATDLDARAARELDPETERRRLRAAVLQMASEDEGEVLSAARTLRALLSHRDAAIALYIHAELVAMPLALQSICNCVLLRQKQWSVLTPTLALREAPSNGTRILHRLTKHTVFTGEPLSHVRWLRVPRTTVRPESFALLFDERTGQATCRLALEGAHREETLQLLSDMAAQSRHLCLALSRVPGLSGALHFLAASAPPPSPLAPLAQRLVAQLRTGELLLQGRRDPRAPARDRAFNAGAVPRALEDYAVRTAAGRLAPPGEESPAGGSERTGPPEGRGGRAGAAQCTRQAVRGETALPPHLQPLDSRYGAGLHVIAHPAPPGSLRAGTRGLELGRPRGGPLERVRHVAGALSVSWLREGDCVSSFDADI